MVEMPIKLNKASYLFIVGCTLFAINYHTLHGSVQSEVLYPAYMYLHGFHNDKAYINYCLKRLVIGYGQPVIEQYKSTTV